MNSDAGILIVIFLMVAMIIGFIVLMTIILLRKPNSSTSSVASTKPAVSGSLTSTQGAIVWSENRRGFYSANEFPPCVNGVTEISKIYAILKALSLERKYMMLLDVYSMVLCQRNQQNNMACSVTYLQDRINDLSNYGADVNDKKAISTVNSVTRIGNNKIANFLVMACDLIEKQIAKMANDPDISSVDRQAINGFNSEFYRTQFDTINNKCLA